MIGVRDLLFFDKYGNNYGFVYDENTNLWSGTIYIDEVSRGLFETQRIMVMQKYIKYAESNELEDLSDVYSQLVNPTYTYEYGKPNYENSPNDYYLFEWDNSIKEVDEINLYGIDDSEICDQTPDTSSLTYNEYTCPRIKFTSGIKVDDLIDAQQQVSRVQTTQPYKDEYTYNNGSDIDDSVSFIDICFCNADDKYNTFRRDLMLYYVDCSASDEVRTLVGVFTVYAESIEEDERLSVMCGNLGYDIDNIDFTIFKDTDIKEQLIDYDFMNLKRKEALMEGHNIYSYIGSYKSVLNAIKFFGYDNVSIKEWWKNVNVNSEDYGKYFVATSYSLENHEAIKGKTNITLPNKNFRKVPKLTLAYKINALQRVQNTSQYVQADSSYYGHGYPATDEQFTYTIEEAVIKLFGLKRKLDKVFLPLTTKIVDVVGEADSFYASVVTHVMTANMTENTYAGNPVDFDIIGGDEYDCFYLEDLRPFGLYDLRDPNYSGYNMVGESLSGGVSYIPNGNNTKSFITATPDTRLSELGLQNIGGMNTNYSLDDSSLLTFQGLTHDNPQDALQHPTLFPLGGDLQDISSLQSIYSSCVPPNELYPKVFDGVYGSDEPMWRYYPFYTQMLESQGEPHNNYFLAHFSDYYPNLSHNAVPANTFDYDSAEYLPDTEYAVSGALVRLKFDNGDICSRIQWDIYKPETDTPEFHTKILGMFSDGYGDIGVVLPYVGTYDIVMTVYGFDNSISVKTKQNCVTVEPREVEMTGWCVMAREYCGWNSEICWNDATFEWRLPIINNASTSENKSASYESMDRATFVGEYVDETEPDSTMYYYEFEDAYFGLQGVQEPMGYGARLVSVGPYYWKNLDCNWDDLSHLWWDAMCISGDLPAYFEFGYFDMSGNCTSSPNQSDTIKDNWLEIVGADYRYGDFRFPSNLSGGVNELSNAVRLLNECNDPVISRYHYSWVYDYTGNGNGNPDIAANEPIGFKIVGVAKSVNRSADILYAGIVDTAHHAIPQNGSLVIQNNDTNPCRNQFRYLSNTLSYNPNWFNCVYINNVTRIPRYTDVSFNYSNCKIVGKKNPKWTITNLNTGTVYESTRKNYRRMFRERGCYEIALTLEDNNGNTYSAKRNMLIIE